MPLVQLAQLLHQLISDPDGSISTPLGTSVTKGARRFHFLIGRASVHPATQHGLG